jgi:hypothetical protein
MRRLLVAAMAALSLTALGVFAVYADNPHARQSGNFKGSARRVGRLSLCPPHGSK